MQPGLIRSFIRDEGGAISPLYAVGILVLVAIAGVGFDYGRIMALDTELQNAADQAALAAATQLDGGDGARQRAQDAVNASLANSVVNRTNFANDKDADGRTVSITTVEFFNGYAVDADTDTFGDPATGDQDAKVVQVTVKPRKVRYALTPLVGAIFGEATGKAAAMLQEATCNVPPMMFCVPNNESGEANRNFPTAADIGKQLALHYRSNDIGPSDNWAPGNFGFLNIDYGIPNNLQNLTMGLNSSFAGCTGEAIESEPGFRTPQSVALNSRFDIYPTGNSNNRNCDPSTGNFCPAQNVRKGFTVTQTVVIRGGNQPPMPECGASGATYSDFVLNNAASGLPEDNCFINGQCSVLGDGDWNLAAYMATHHPTVTGYDASTFSDTKTELSDITRYDVYKWELEEPLTRLRPQPIGTPPAPTYQGNGANRRWTFTRTCAFSQPLVPENGVEATDTQKDRRILTVAAVDCTNLQGRGVVDIVRWVDLFLLSPVKENGEDRDFMTEIIGPARKADESSGFQYFSKRKAVLIR